jgi:hypothetical protein
MPPTVRFQWQLRLVVLQLRGHQLKSVFYPLASVVTLASHKLMDAGPK